MKNIIKAVIGIIVLLVICVIVQIITKDISNLFWILLLGGIIIGLMIKDN